MNRQPKMIPNPLWCEKCEGRGYLVADAEWEPYAVQCHECADRRRAWEGEVEKQHVEIERLRAAVEDAIETLEAMDLYVDNPLYDRLRSVLEKSS